MKLSDIKKVLFLWIGYVLTINIYTFILAYLHKIPVKEVTIKEVCFGLWGYWWDGMHYISIAQHGYRYPEQAFFPLYPLIIKFLDIFLPLTFAYRINVILLAAVLVLLHLFMQYLNIQQKFRTLLLFLAFPTAFFLQANYTETIYIFLAVLGLIFLLKKKYLYAAVFAGLLSATKISGISLGIVVLISFFINRDKSKGWLNFGLLLFGIALVSFSGIFLYALYLNQHWGSFLIFFRAQDEWGRSISITGGNLLYQIYNAIKTYDLYAFRRVGEIFSFILVVWAAFKSFKKIAFEIWLFSIFQIIIPLSSGTFLSFNRLVFLCFPFLLIGLDKFAKNKVVFCVVLALFFLCQLLGIYLFLSNYFIG